MAVCWGWEQQTQEAPAQWEGGLCGGQGGGVGLHFLWLSLLWAVPLPLAEPRACCTLFLCDKHKQPEPLYQQPGSHHFPNSW